MREDSLAMKPAHLLILKALLPGPQALMDVARLLYPKRARNAQYVLSSRQVGYLARDGFLTRYSAPRCVRNRNDTTQVRQVAFLKLTAKGRRHAAA